MVKITQSHGYSVRELRQLEKNPQGPNPAPTHGGPTRLGRLSGRVRGRHSWRVGSHREYIHPRLECGRSGGLGTAP